MSSAQKPVPRLDLAPKLKRPLSLLNPLDYLRLVYWLLYFPQGLRWYIEKFMGQPVALIGKASLKEEWEKYSKNKEIKKLILQILIILFILPILLIFFGIDIYSSYLIYTSSLLFFLSSCFFWVKKSFFLVIILSLEYASISVVFTLFILHLFEFNPISSSSANKLLNIIIFLIILLIFIKISIFDKLIVINQLETKNKSFNLFSKLKNVIGKIFVLYFPLSLLVSYFSSFENIFDFLWINLIIVLVGVFRLDAFILHLPLMFKKANFNWPNITLIPIPNLDNLLHRWLIQDWEIGIYNTDQVLTYTIQWVSVSRAIRKTLNKIPPEQIVFRTAQLADYSLNLIFICWLSPLFLKGSILLFLYKINNITTKKILKKINILINKKIEKKVNSLITKPYAAVGGFFNLASGQPKKASQLFDDLRCLPYGEEMFILSRILLILKEVKNFEDIVTLELPNLPPEPYLRSRTWVDIKALYQVFENVKLIKNSASRSARSLALNRAQGEIEAILEQSETLPEVERGLIIDIAKNWQSALLGITKEVGKISRTEKVINPYIIGDPVIGKQFIGRDDIIKGLEELWISTPQLQSVVIFGHRRMGKTSILRNISTRLDSKVKLAYVNLLTVGNNIQGVGEVLMAIADSLSDTLQIPPPDDDSLINLPYRTFERYLKQIETQLGDTGLIIALDEFEQIEELIKSDRIPKDFMGVLRGMVQMSPKIAFALAGLHTLEEMTEDYFNPFFASIIPIRVSFLERATCRYLLANPSEDFPLDYKPDALDYIYDLTAGQPYLVQLIGFLLVRRYNDQVFELGNNRDPMFTIADVDGIINQPEFYQNGRYYFTGVWQQAGEGSLGQQEIIKAIAPHPTGLDFNTLQTVTNLDPISLQNALDTLARHDVIQEIDHHWQIIVELFRRWVVSHQNN